MHRLIQIRLCGHTFSIYAGAGAEAGIPASWKQFSGRYASLPSCDLFVTDGLQERSANPGRHWEQSESDGAVSSTYYDFGAALFSLSPFPDRRGAEIRLACFSARLLSISVQYAVMLLLAKECTGFHAVTVQLNDQVIALSAPSGTGKTTLAGLLEKYAGARIINGDFALLSTDGKDVFFEPAPFCGSSGVFSLDRQRIDRIVFLRQAPHNSMSCPDARTKLNMMLKNCFVPQFHEAEKNSIVTNISTILNCIPADLFSFAPVKEAADCFIHNVSIGQYQLAEIKGGDYSMKQANETRREFISDDELNKVAGGNDHVHGKTDETWTCAYCGAVIQCKQEHDKAKHMAKCPKNPLNLL